LKRAGFTHEKWWISNVNSFLRVGIVLQKSAKKREKPSKLGQSGKMMGSYLFELLKN
jgi:hypothetical protein